MKIVIVLFICCLPFVSLSQTSKQPNVELSNEKRVEILKWYLDATEKGIIHFVRGRWQDLSEIQKLCYKLPKNQKRGATR